MSHHAHGYQQKLLWKWMILYTLLSCIIHDVAGQIGLTSPSFNSMTLRSGGGILALPLTGPAPKSATSGLLSKLSERQLPPQRSASTRESEIAAIFRGVAYGAPTFSSNTTTSTTSTPTTTKASPAFTTTIQAPSTTPFSNSLHDPVRSELMRHQFGKGNDFVLTTKTIPDDLEENSDSISYVVHKDNGFSDVSYLHRTPDPSSALSKNNHEFPTASSDDKDTIIINKKVMKGSTDEVQHFPMISVKWALGAAWWIHVYVSAGLFALIAAASLCCMARFSPASHLLSRLQYIILLILIFLATLLRCLHLFHDPYGIENRLPDVLSSVVQETSWPCLTGALAILALALYQSCKYSRVFPKSNRLPYTLIFFTVAHLIVSVSIHLTANFLEKYSFPLRIAAQSITITWGCIVGIGSIWTVWKVERLTGRYSSQFFGRHNRSATDDLVSSGQPHTAVTRGAILTLVAGVAQIVLAVLHLYIMLAPVMPTKHVWIWWGRVSMARGLELIVSAAVLLGAFILTFGRPSNTRQDSTIFSVLTSCGRDGKNVKGGRTANVFPVQNEKRQILGSFNLHSNKPPVDNTSIKRMPIDWTYTTPRCVSKSGTIDSVTSDFQLLWNRDRTQSAASFRPSSMLVNDSGFVRFRTHVDPEQAMDEVFNKSSLNLHKIPPPQPYTNVQNYSTQTLPNSRYYCTPTPASLSSPERTPLRNPIRAQTVRAQRSRPDYLRHHMRNRAMSQIRDKSSWTPVTSASKYDVRTLDKYEVASYYNSSLTSNGSNMYSTPHTVSPSQQFLKVHGSRGQLPGVHGVHHYEETRNLKPASVEAISGLIEPSTCSSLSEIHVDYLTDVSSSNDCMNQHTAAHMNRSKRNQSLLTLPLSSSHSNYAQTLPTYTTPTGRTPPSHLPDITPDSAVILDYSTSAETEEEADKDDKNNKSLDLVKISSNSLNDVLKSQARAGLLSKIVGSSMSVSCYGYSPLDVEDTSSPSQEDSTMTKIRKIVSSTDANDANEVPELPTTPPVHCKPSNTVTSL